MIHKTDKEIRVTWLVALLVVVMVVLMAVKLVE